MLPGLDLYYADPVQLLKTAREELDDLHNIICIMIRPRCENFNICFILQNIRAGPWSSTYWQYYYTGSTTVLAERAARVPVLKLFTYVLQ